MRYTYHFVIFIHSKALVSNNNNNEKEQQANSARRLERRFNGRLCCFFDSSTEQEGPPHMTLPRNMCCLTFHANALQTRRSVVPTPQKAVNYQEYLGQCHISENDPALLFNWDPTQVQLFVDAANDVATRIVARPHWLTPGPLTAALFQTSVISFLRLVAGGSFGMALLAPNNIVEFGNVRDRLTGIESDPFIQECMALLPAGAVLATTSVITDRTIARGTACARAITLPHRLVFA